MQSGKCRRAHRRRRFGERVGSGLGAGQRPQRAKAFDRTGQRRRCRQVAHESVIESATRPRAFGSGFGDHQ